MGSPLKKFQESPIFLEKFKGILDIPQKLTKFQERGLVEMEISIQTLKLSEFQVKDKDNISEDFSLTIKYLESVSLTGKE